jgi:hypothetical protein
VAAGFVGGGEQDRDAVAGCEAAGREAERDAGVVVPGVRVVDADQQRVAGAQRPQQSEERGGCEPRQGRVVGLGRQRSGRGAEQGVQSAVRQGGLGGGGPGVQDRSAATAPDGVARERAAAEAGRRGDDEGAAAALSQEGQHPVQ